MKFSQISPRQLICENDTFWKSFIQFFIIGAIGAACFAYGTYTPNPSFKIGLYAFIVGTLVCVFQSQLTITFDLDRQFVQFKQHWFLFQGNRYQQYPIAEIKDIEVYQMRIQYYHPAIRLKNGKLLLMTNNPNTESDAMQDVLIIREFLRLDTRYRNY